MAEFDNLLFFINQTVPVSGLPGNDAGVPAGLTPMLADMPIVPPSLFQGAAADRPAQNGPANTPRACRGKEYPQREEVRLPDRRAWQSPPRDSVPPREKDRCG